LEETFSTLIDTYLDTQVGVADDFLSTALTDNLKDNLRLLFKDKLMHNAGTGNDVLIVQNKLVRSDKIYWLDRSHNNIHENAFFNVIDSFVSYLNRTCYAGITGYEFHYTLYEKGSFYKKHIDQFQQNGSRAFSMILYLNTDWQPEDGGELCIHHAHHLQYIAPMNGKSVFFKSSALAHEVLLTDKARMSITGWLKTN
jgi:SM-20-related protein